MASVQLEHGKHTMKQVCSGIISHDFRENENYSNGDVDLKACAEAAKRSCAATVPFIYEQDLPDGDIAENAADSFAVLRDLA